MARKILRLLGSRYGIAAILLVLVIVVVGIARTNGGTGPDNTVDGEDSAGTSDAGEPNDGVATAPNEEPDADDSVLPGEAVKVATAFAEDYIDTDRSAKGWRAALGKNATRKVKDDLKIIDPKTVPMTEIRDDPNATGQTVEFPTDAGLLILPMKEQDGVWLVNGIDQAKSLSSPNDSGSTDRDGYPGRERGASLQTSALDAQTPVVDGYGSRHGVAVLRWFYFLCGHSDC